MPPKRSTAASTAAGGDQGPTLKLIIEKGPLSGTTREFKPGTAVRIGRLVRGNKLAIKDAGISSNHLVIQPEAAPEPDGWRWTVSDLDSSNGTFLNGTLLEPFQSAALSQGDTIKIGEITSIRVELVKNTGEDNEAVSGVRRNARRRVREPATDLDVIDEFAKLGLQNNVEEVKIEVEATQGRYGSTRRTRNSSKTDNLATVEEDTDLGKSGIKGSRGVSTRRTGSSRKEEHVEVDLSAIEGKRTRGGRGRKKLFVETICEETEKIEPNPEHETREEEKQRSEIAGDELKSSATEEGVAAGATASPVEAGKGKMKMVADLEKMTLGEWLDFVATYEPQQIIAETEEMLAEMRRKAERFHEFLLQQKKAQG